MDGVQGVPAGLTGTPIQGVPPGLTGTPISGQQQGGQQQQATQQQQGDGAPPQQGGGVLNEFLGTRSLRDLLPDSVATTLNRVGHSPGEALQNLRQRINDAPMGAVRSITTGVKHGLEYARDTLGTHVFDNEISRNDQFLSDTAPKTEPQHEAYSAGDTMAGMMLGKWIDEGLGVIQIAKNMKSIPVLTKLAEQNPHIAKIISAGIRSGTANAATTGIMGGSTGDVGNAFLTGGALGAAGQAPTEHANYIAETAGKYAPDVTDIGGKQFTEVSQAAKDKGITTQEQEPAMREANRQAYEELRDQSVRGRAAQGTADTINAMEPTQPKVSVAGAQRLKAKTSVSTAPPETPITDANPRQIEVQQRFLQKILDSNKFTQGVKDRAQVQLDKINTQQQAVTDFKNNPDNFRTETPISPKVLMQNSTNLGEFAEEIRRQAEARTQDMQWHERQYDANGEVEKDASGNEVWKPVDMKTMSRSQQDMAIADGDLAKRDTRNLSAVDVKQGLRMGRMAEAAQKLDDVTQKIYDLSRERTESIQQQTGQPNLRQEPRTANMQSHLDELEALSKQYAPEFKDMFGRKDGITDLMAAAQKIGYADNGAKYSGALSDYFLKTLTKRATLQGKGGLGVGLWAAMKTVGLKSTVVGLAGEAAAEAAHRQFMHRVATDPVYANKVLTKDRSPRMGIRFTASSLANLGSQVSAREDVSKKVQEGEASKSEDID